jgi:broad specificity phosphatase PhoE
LAALSTLYLIRHGQASAGGPDYDVLSELGATQAKRLGAWFVGQGIRLDALHTGPRRRQMDTARHFVGAAAGHAPDAALAPEFDEFPAEGILSGGLPALLEEEPALAQQSIGRVLALLSRRWVRGELDLADVETFVAFRARVRRGLDAIQTAAGRGKRVAVVTSAGAITVSLMIALELSDELGFMMATIVANASITEFRFRPGELTLVGFNGLPHLERKDLITYF